jgi:hypothetical protein
MVLRAQSENAHDSIIIKSESDSNAIDERKRQHEKQDEPITST